jgi:hypothetical protein
MMGRFVNRPYSLGVGEVETNPANPTAAVKCYPYGEKGDNTAVR